MRRYEFRLATVLRLRRAEEEQARDRLAQANVRLRACILDRDAESARYRALSASTSATTVDGLRAEQQATALAAAVAERARASVAAAANEAALAQLAWQAAARRVEVLERLDVRRREEHSAAEARAEVAEVDDVVAARFLGARRADEDEARQGAAR